MDKLKDTHTHTFSFFLVHSYSSIRDDRYECRRKGTSLNAYIHHSSVGRKKRRGRNRLMLWTRLLFFISIPWKWLQAINGPMSMCLTFTQMRDREHKKSSCTGSVCSKVMRWSCKRKTIEMKHLCWLWSMRFSWHWTRHRQYRQSMSQADWSVQLTNQHFKSNVPSNTQWAHD